ncbi:MAG TPA: AAA family ATPase [Candidatus Baltobacteraceae bacterium]|nr:AAA family ATPase [Candidatus Baltobacteraceae bacterium]
MTAAENDETPDRCAGGTQQNTTTDTILADAADEVLLWLNTIYPQQTGLMFAAGGIGPKWEDGEYRHREHQEAPIPLDGLDRAELAATIADRARTVDLWAPPASFYKTRKPESLHQAWALISDWDGTLAKLAEALACVELLGGCAIASGTRGHLQVIVPLTAPIVTSAEYQRYMRALCEYLPDGADAKVSCNDLTRIAGTFNHKPTVRPGDTGQPIAVAWAVRPSGKRIRLDDLARRLKIDAPGDTKTAGDTKTPGGAQVEQQPFNLDDHPRVRAAIDSPVFKADIGQEDRSESCYKIVAAVVDAGLTQANAEWAARQSITVSERLDAHPEDVARIWAKLSDKPTDPPEDEPKSDKANGDKAKSDKAKSGQGVKIWNAKNLRAAGRSTFLAKNRIPMAAVTVLCGAEGIGKSLLLIRIVVAVTTGQPMPEFGIPKREPADVFLILTEDTWADVLARLEVAGADLDRIKVLCEEADGSGSPVFPRDMGLILNADPAPAFIGVDAWLDTVPGTLRVGDTQQAREALHPWKEAATATGAAVLLLTHPNRLGTANIRDLYGATAALRQKARMTLFALADEDHNLIVGPDKSNSVKAGIGATKFKIDAVQHYDPTPDSDGTVPALKYLGETAPIRKVLAAIAAQQNKRDRAPSSAEQWLTDYLGDHKAHKSVDVYRDGKDCEHEFSGDQLKRAKERLSVHTFKGTEPHGTAHYWWWQLREPAND